MISKAVIKDVRLLHQKKYRDEEGLFIAEGPRLVDELLRSRFKVKEVFGTADYQIPDQAVSVTPVSEKELQSISALTTCNQVLGVFEIPKAAPPEFDGLILALDDIRDPGNLGTILRIADWFGVNEILCSETCVDVYNPKVIQSTMGSIARVKVCYGSLGTFLSQYRKRPGAAIYAAVMDGKNMYSEKLSEKGIIVIGNESKGISEGLMQYATHKISIPRTGKAESLNAAIAAAVICAEFRRR